MTPSLSGAAVCSAGKSREAAFPMPPCSSVWVVIYHVVLILLTGCVPAFGATITGDLRDLGNVALNTPVQFVPQSNPQIIGSTINAGVTKTVTPVLGLFSTNIVSGIYTIRIAPYEWRNVYIPTNESTYTLGELSTNLIQAPNYTNNPNFKVKFDTSDTIAAFLTNKLYFRTNFSLTLRTNSSGRYLILDATGGVTVGAGSNITMVTNGNVVTISASISGGSVSGSDVTNIFVALSSLTNTSIVQVQILASGTGATNLANQKIASSAGLGTNNLFFNPHLTNSGTYLVFDNSFSANSIATFENVHTNGISGIDMITRGSNSIVGGLSLIQGLAGARDDNVYKNKAVIENYYGRTNSNEPTDLVFRMFGDAIGGVTGKGWARAYFAGATNNTDPNLGAINIHRGAIRFTTFDPAVDDRTGGLDTNHIGMEIGPNGNIGFGIPYQSVTGVAGSATGRAVHLRSANALPAFKIEVAGLQTWSMGIGGSPYDFLIRDEVNGVNWIDLTTSGFLGLGSVAPTNTLDVKGNVSLRSNVWMHTLPGSGDFLADAGGQIRKTNLTATLSSYPTFTVIGTSNYVKTVSTIATNGASGASVNSAGLLTITDMTNSLSVIETNGASGGSVTVGGLITVQTRTNFAANTSPVIGGTSEVGGITNSGKYMGVGAFTNLSSTFVTGILPGTGSNVVQDVNGNFRLAAIAALGGSQTPWTSAIDGAGYALSGVDSIATTNMITASISNTGTNPVSRFMAMNPTAAATNSQQASGMYSWIGQVWSNNGANSASIPYSWSAGTLPVQAAVPTSIWFLETTNAGARTRPLTLTSAGALTTSSDVAVGSGGTANLTANNLTSLGVFIGGVIRGNVTALGTLRLADITTGSSFSNLLFGSASAVWPALRMNGAGMQLIGGNMVGSGTNHFYVSGVVAATNGFVSRADFFTTAGTAVNWNSNNVFAGRVKLGAGSQSYFITNAVITANAVVFATVNTEDVTATLVRAIPAAGLLTLKTGAAATADTDLSWKIESP